MLVVVVAMVGVPVPVMDIIHVAAMGDALMPAAGVMSVGMAGMGQVRQRVLVVVIVMLGVSMALVHIVDVTLALGAGVPAAGSVLVGVGGMDDVFSAHSSS